MSEKKPSPDRPGLRSRRLASCLAICLALLAAPLYAKAPSKSERLVRAARAYVGLPIEYDGGYREILYPGGDPGGNVGGCTDLVIRAYRGIGVDLQVLVHQDISKDFDAYPASRLYTQTEPDTNIDHRRVPILFVFLQRNATPLPLSIGPADADNWQPGDLVLFDLVGNGMASHIAIVSDKKAGSGLPLLIHHFPPRPEEDDSLGRWKIVGHYRYYPPRTTGGRTGN